MLALSILAISTAPSEAATPTTIVGTVTDVNGAGIRVIIRAWTLSESSGQWEYHSTASDDSSGAYSITLNPGTYRLSFNAKVGAPPPKNYWKGEFYPDAETIDDAVDVTLVEGQAMAIDAQLAFAQGSISGRVTDVAGNPITSADVEVLDAAQTIDPFNPYPQAYSSYTIHTGPNGEYTVRGLGVPTRLRITQDTGGYVTEYYNDTTDWSSAESFDPVAGVDLVGKDVQLTSLPIEVISKPRVYGTLGVSWTVSAVDDEWSSGSVTKKYQWYRSGTTTVPITGATLPTYKITATDRGKRLKVKIISSQAGVPSVGSWSTASAVVRYGSTTYLTATSPARATVKLSVIVKKSNGSLASGSVRFSCGNSLITYASRTVTLSSGKAVATFKPVPKGSVACQAKYLGSSSTVGSVRSRTVYVK